MLLCAERLRRLVYVRVAAENTKRANGKDGRWKDVDEKESA